MRLLAVGANRYKRFAARSEMRVDGRVIGIVGPNEAGKTSFLKALAHLSQRGVFSAAEWTRGAARPPDETPVVWARFALDEGDYASLADVPNSGEVRWYELWKAADGELYHQVFPADAARRQRAPRERIGLVLERASAHRLLTESTDEAHDAGQALAKLREGLRVDDETLAQSVVEELRAAADQLEALTLPGAPKYLQELPGHLRDVAAHESTPRPRDVILERLDDRKPAFLVFGNDQRDLRSDYELTEHADSPPAGLANLARLADLDLKALRNSTLAEDFGEAERLLEEANSQLAVQFAESWRQSAVYVRLRTDGTVLRILISATGGGYTGIAERSDGLRAFIGLLTFTSLYGSREPPILLVDEAENHLHYDAQADLIRVFSRQRAAAKVIYTTHSAGSLPQDLAGVRLIVPDEDGHSAVRNAFWEEGPGFTPLLIGMGASVLAFTPTRYAVFTEGGSEVVLLPTLLREALGYDEDLPYQVVPGLSEVTVAQVSGLRLEAARVACLVDGDAAGGRIRTKLLRGGIPGDRIVSLGGQGSGFVLEDMVDSEPYLRAINIELRRSHGEAVQMPMAALRTRNRPGSVRAWCTTAGIPEPAKRAVAYRLLELRTDERARLTSGDRRKRLREAHRQLRTALDLQ